MAAAYGALLSYSPPFSANNRPPTRHLPPSFGNPSSSSHSLLSIVCGPRDSNRGPLLRGRTLSTEAILAVQLLKRWSARQFEDVDSKEKSIDDDDAVKKAVHRLAKPDLMASLAELQRQDQWWLALKVFKVVREEHWYQTDYSIYAEMVKMLARNGKKEGIERNVSVLIKEKFVGDLKGLTKLVRALIGAEMGKCVVEVYEFMRSNSFIPDDELFGVMVKGLKRLGEGESASLIVKDYEEIEKQQSELTKTGRVSDDSGL